MPTSQEQMASLLPAMMAAMAAELIAAANSAQQHVSLPSNGAASEETACPPLAYVKEQQQSVESPFDSSQATGEIKKKCRISRKRGIDEVKVKAVSSTPIPEPNIEVVDSADPCSLINSRPCSNPLPPMISGSSADSCSSSSPKIRKLKLYSMEEKIDIIDYAKVIGNRAAGREFSVAESSIREWRKNEDRLRRQMEQGVDGVITQTAHQFEKENSQVIAQIDEVLVQFINEHSQSADWYAVRDKAAEIWAQMANGSVAEMNISMGWVARFMARSERLIPKLAPPIIATSNALNGTTASLSMVRCSNKDAEVSNPTSHQPNPTKKVRRPSKSKPKPATVLETSQGDDLKADFGNSRRKNKQPRRVEHGATLLTTSSTVPSAPQQTSPAKEKPEMENSQMEKMSSVSDLLAVWLLKNCNAFNGSNPANVLEGNKF